MKLKQLVVASTLIVAAAATPFVTLTVDQSFTGPFAFDMGINATGGVSQGFVPTVTRLDAVDVFITSLGSNPALNIPVNIRSGSFDGPILGSSSIAIPAGLSASPSAPFVAQAEFTTPVTLTPGSLYYIQVDPDGGFGLGVAASFDDGYPAAAGYQGDFTLTGLDWGFRTYFGESGVGPPTNKDQCKNGGWATFTIPRAFKNQGDCIQFVNTGK